MASVNIQALQQDRQVDRGSDETALNKRRAIQHLVRTGDEHVIPQLILSLSAFLGAKTREDAKDLLPAAIASAQGLGRLCDPSPSQRKVYPTPLSKDPVTAEQLLLHSLRTGNNRLQATAAEALGLIGQQRFSLDDLQEREQFDKSATVKAKCKMAIRRIQQRNKQPQQEVSDSEIDLIILSACSATDIDIKIKTKGRFKVSVNIETPQEELADMRAEETDKTVNKDNRTQTVEITGHLDKRTLASGRHINFQYLCISTVCGPANEQIIKTAMKMNSNCLKPDDIQHDYAFVEGALAIRSDELLLIQSLPVAFVTADQLRQTIMSIANSGDEIEKKLYKGKDFH